MANNVIIVSHRRSGTHLAVDTISNNFEAYARGSDKINKLTLDHLCKNSHHQVSVSGFSKNLFRSSGIFKTHAHSGINRFFGNSSEVSDLVRRLFDSSKIIYVYRDGRDVMVSLYYYMKTLNARFDDMSISEFIRMPNNFSRVTYDGELNRVEYWRNHVSGWLDDDSVLGISFESLIEDYDNTLNSIAMHLEQDMPENIIPVARRSGNNKIAGMVPLRKMVNYLTKKVSRTSNSAVQFRKGQPGGFRGIMSEDDMAFFHFHAGALMGKLGYDK